MTDYYKNSKRFIFDMNDNRNNLDKIFERVGKYIEKHRVPKIVGVAKPHEVVKFQLRRKEVELELVELYMKLDDLYTVGYALSVECDNKKWKTTLFELKPKNTIGFLQGSIGFDEELRYTYPAGFDQFGFKYIEQCFLKLQVTNPKVNKTIVKDSLEGLIVFICEGLRNLWLRNAFHALMAEPETLAHPRTKYCKPVWYKDGKPEYLTSRPTLQVGRYPYSHLILNWSHLSEWSRSAYQGEIYKHPFNMELFRQRQVDLLESDRGTRYVGGEMVLKIKRLESKDFQPGGLVKYVQAPKPNGSPTNPTNPYGHVFIELHKSKFQSFGKFYSLRELNDERVYELPISILILLESAVRNCDNYNIKPEDVANILNWKLTREIVDIPFKPARVLLQDSNGLPALVDLAFMRNLMESFTGDYKSIDPMIPVDFVTDHVVPHDVEQGVTETVEKEKLSFLKWASKAFTNLRVLPLGCGNAHQANLEFIAQLVTNTHGVLHPDTVIGTGSHTTMINGLGVCGWGVGGMEAIGAILGQPLTLRLPGVVGFKLVNQLKAEVTVIDLALTISWILKGENVDGKFIEFYGDGVKKLSVDDRATVAQMCPEFGATVAFFPVDTHTLDYLKATGRHDDDSVHMLEAYLRANNMFVDDNESQRRRVYSSELKLDLKRVNLCVSGPRRPHDRVFLKDMKADWRSFLHNQMGFKGFAVLKEAQEKVVHGKQERFGHGSVVIAAITSCASTSNLSVMRRAGLVAKNARALGLEVKPWVKTSLAPVFGVVRTYLQQSGLQIHLDELGFKDVGCTTSIGNSWDLDEAVVGAIKDNEFIASAVISGNRNFEGSVHALTKANYLASPPMVVVYALAGTVDINFYEEPIGIGKNGKDVYLKEIWPKTGDINDVTLPSVHPEEFKYTYESFINRNPEWNAPSDPEPELYKWDENSTYIHEPSYITKMSENPPEAWGSMSNAYCLLMLGDSITTDHVYGSGFCHDENMARNTFPTMKTTHYPSGESLSIFDAAKKYGEEKKHKYKVVLAGEDYGSGSSKDSAAKALKFLDVKVVIAKSYERIHKRNLIGIGILPLSFKEGEDIGSLQLEGSERFTVVLTIKKFRNMVPRQDVIVTTDRGKSFRCTACFDTQMEVNYFNHGGILPYLMRQLLTQPSVVTESKKWGKTSKKSLEKEANKVPAKTRKERRLQNKSNETSQEQKESTLRKQGKDKKRS